jgi:YVTN family beta-propeller protein
MRSVLRVLRGGYAVFLLAALLSGCASSTRKSVAAPAEAGDDSAVVARIPLDEPPNEVAVAPSGSRAYATAAGKIFVIDTANNAVANTITLPQHPVGIAISADGSRAYVADFSSTAVWAIDTVTNRLTATIEIGPPKAAASMPMPAVVVTRDGSAVYITNPGDDTLLVIDTANSFVRTRIALHMHPSGAAVTPDGGFVYVSGCPGLCSSGMITVVDTRMYVISDSVPTAWPLSHIAMNPNGEFAYASGGSALLVVDTRTNNVITQIPGEFGSEVNVTADGALVYVHGSRLAVVDAASNAVAATIPLPSGVTSFALRPDAALGYFAAPDGLYVIDTRPPSLKAAGR